MTLRQSCKCSGSRSGLLEALVDGGGGGGQLGSWCLWDMELSNWGVQRCFLDPQRRGGVMLLARRGCVWEGGAGVPKVLLWSKQRLSSYLGGDTLPPTHWAPNHTPQVSIWASHRKTSAVVWRCWAAPVSAAGGNLMMHLFTLCSVVLDPQQDLQISHRRYHHQEE